jgi:hypothetical protein
MLDQMITALESLSEHDLEAVLNLAGRSWLALVADLLARYPACSDTVITAAAALIVAVNGARVHYHPDALNQFNEHLAADNAPWRLVTLD